DQDCDGVTDGSVDAFTGSPVALQDSCYTGPDGTAGIGECITGTITCSSGTWGVCASEVLPTDEACGDTADNDCDGIVDGIIRREGFEDPSCDLGDITFVQDVDSMSCVVTPGDVSDPVRTPTGAQSLMLSIVRGSNDRYAALEWRFDTCAPTATGSIDLHVAAETPGDMMVYVTPVFIGESVEFFYYGAGNAEVLVRNGDGVAVNAQTVLLGVSEWHELSWSFTPSGRFAYALDGAEFFSETIESSIIGAHLEFHVLRTPGANPRVLIDDVTFSSP
ncbi:hypothetical protein HY634_03790, partial [Candidatus Uhrbacteria bacterium]|nr:hypothetical protein [Candidatus Uhrbacteria bacterium]